METIVEWIPFLVTAVMAFAMPACAVVAAPRQFGLSLLSGWIGGGSVVFLSSPVVIVGIFELTLLALLVVNRFLSYTKIPG